MALLFVEAQLREQDAKNQYLDYWLASRKEAISISDKLLTKKLVEKMIPRGKQRSISVQTNENELPNYKINKQLLDELRFGHSMGSSASSVDSDSRRPPLNGKKHVQRGRTERRNVQLEDNR